MKVLQVVGYKNAGKTTLVCEIVRMLSAEGIRVATLKRDAHQVDPEPEGADTRLHREAGAFLSGMSSDCRTSWVREQPAELDALLAEAAQAGAEIVIVEGFKSAAYAKIVMLRGAEDAALLRLTGIAAVAVRDANTFRNHNHPGDITDPNVVSGLSDFSATVGMPAELPLFHTNDFQFNQLLDFVRAWLNAANYSANPLADPAK